MYNIQVDKNENLIISVEISIPGEKLLDYTDLVEASIVSGKCRDHIEPETSRFNIKFSLIK